MHNTERAQARSRLLPDTDTLQVMRLFMPNADKLFARLCRIFSHHELNILSARAYITENNYILDTFIVQIPARHHRTDYAYIQSALEARLNNFIHGHHAEDGATCGIRSRARLPSADFAAHCVDARRPPGLVYARIGGS